MAIGKGMVLLAAVAAIIVIVVTVGITYRNEIQAGLGGGDDGGPLGASVVNFRVFLSDGTYQDFNASLNKNIFGGYSVAKPSMSISLPGTNTQITKVRSTIIGKIDGADVQAWVSTSEQRIEFYKAGVSAPLISSTGSYPGGGQAWPKGTEQTMANLDLPGSDINAVVKQYSNVAGSYSLQYVAFVSLTALVDGQNQYLESHVVGTLNFDYKPDGSGSTLTFSARIAPQPIT